MALTPTAAQLAILRLNQALFGTACGTDEMAAALPSFDGNIDDDGNAYAQALIDRTSSLSILSPLQLFERVLNNISASDITAADKAALAAGLVPFVDAGLTVGATVNLLSAFLYNNAATLDNVWANTANQLKNQTTVASFYTLDQGNAAASSDVLAPVTYDPATVTAATGSVAPSQTFTLTNGADTGAAFTGTAGNDTFEAPVTMAANGTTLVDTLQNIDSLNGGDGTDTLKATLNGGAVVTPSLAGIENVELRVTAAASALDLSAATGVTSVTIAGSNVSSTAVGGTVAGLGAVANLAVKNQKGDVSFDGSTAATLNLTLDTIGTGGATGVHTVVDLGLVAAAKATTLNITANNANADVTDTQGGAVTTLTVAATGTNELDMIDVATTATKVTVTGTGSVNFDANAFSGVLTEVTVGDGGVTMTGTDGTDNKLALVTGAGADTLTFDGSALKSASTGAGNDKLTVGTADVLATTTINMGAGDDTLTFNAVKFATGATLNGGDGTDTIAFNKANYALIGAYAADKRALVTNFETLGITDILTAAAGPYDVSSITGITNFYAMGGVTNAETSAVTNLGANATVTLGGTKTAIGVLSVALKTDTADDTITLKVFNDYTDNNDTTADAVATAASFTASSIENVILVSSGKINTITPVDGYKADIVTNTVTLTNNDLVTLTINGDQKASVTTAAGMADLTTINASGNTAGVIINASAAASTSPALTITGTAKADTISGGALGDTITLGNGNDIVDYNAGGASKIGTGKFDVITDFSANTKADSDTAPTQANADATKWTGDVLKFDSGDGSDGVVFDIFTNAADATTFLANNMSATNGITAALDSTNNNLYVDNTGDGVADFFIKLTGVTTLTEAAFVVV